jgi:LEA14-like dessication related protein
MNNRTLFLVIAIVLMLNACKKPQGFEYREIKHAELKHLGFSKTIVLIDLAYYNPNSFSLTLKKVDCEVFLNQNYLGKYLLDTTMHIAGKSIFVVPASVEFDMGDFLKRGASILFNKEALIGVKGTTRVGKFGIYRNIPIQYETKYKLPF